MRNTFSRHLDLCNRFRMPFSFWPHLPSHLRLLWWTQPCGKYQTYRIRRKRSAKNGVKSKCC